MPDDDIRYEGGIDERGEPFVDLVCGDKVIASMTPRNARLHARAVITTAAVAEQDAMLRRWLLTQMGEEAAARKFEQFTRFRQENS